MEGLFFFWGGDIFLVEFLKLFSSSLRFVFLIMGCLGSVLSCGFFEGLVIVVDFYSGNKLLRIYFLVFNGLLSLFSVDFYIGSSFSFAHFCRSWCLRICS